MAVRDASEAGSGPSKRGPYRRRSQQTMAGTLAAALLAEATNARRITWPNVRADTDPVWFFRSILGVELWDKQREAALATTQHKRVAISSGHKTGKSYLVAGLALSKYCAYSDSRVVFTSTTSRQVDDILWRQTRQLIAEAGMCVDCKRVDPHGPRPCPHSALIDGNIGDLARTGLKAGFREIKGFTAREAEAVAGISGAHLWYFPDEASGIPEDIFQAIEGNRAGGAQLVMTSNPTKTEGTFFEAFHGKKDTWCTITISSAETPNCTIAPGTIPGLADPEWIEEKLQEWGEDSAFFKVRVLGLFPTNEDGKIFSLAMIQAAQERWLSTPAPAPTDVGGRLFIGVDPAGASGQGDETAICVRRGIKILGLFTRRGLSEEAHLVEVLGTCARFKGPGEVPVVVLDRDGKIGAQVYGLMMAYSTAHPTEFELTPVRSSDAAIRNPRVYDRIRDELVSSAEDWVRNGGTLPEDSKLEQELHFLEWVTGPNGKTKVTPKSEIRKALSRSPDRYDAFALSVWEARSLYDHPATVAEPATPAKTVTAEYEDLGVCQNGALDPWAAIDTWGR